MDGNEAYFLKISEKKFEISRNELTFTQYQEELSTRICVKNGTRKRRELLCSQLVKELLHVDFCVRVRKCTFTQNSYIEVSS